jgi:hypothetical protein
MDDEIEQRHTREADRGDAAETERLVEDTLAKAGPEAVHTVRSLATVIYGKDATLEERHRRATRRLVTRLQKRGVPIVPCDDNGKLLSDEEADSRARQGRICMWRCYADGRVTRELLEEAESRNSLADGLVALEFSLGSDVFCEPRERMLKSLRSLVSTQEYEQSRQRYSAALENVRQRREALFRQLLQSATHMKPDPQRATKARYVIQPRPPQPLPVTSGRDATAAVLRESVWTRAGHHDGTGIPPGRSDDRQCAQHNQN